MAFTLTAANIDLMGNTATLETSDLNDAGIPTSVVRVQFRFQPGGPDVESAVTQAKAVLQKALNELAPPNRFKSAAPKRR
jgi:hypothetical protein